MSSSLRKKYHFSNEILLQEGEDSLKKQPGRDRLALIFVTKWLHLYGSLMSGFNEDLFQFFIFTIRILWVRRNHWNWSCLACSYEDQNLVVLSGGYPQVKDWTKDCSKLRIHISGLLPSGSTPLWFWAVRHFQVGLFQSLSLLGMWHCVVWREQ